MQYQNLKKITKQINRGKGFRSLVLDVAMNDKFESLCDVLGIPIPQDIATTWFSRVQKKNKTFLDRIRSLLSQFSSPKYFQAKAIKTTFIHVFFTPVTSNFFLFPIDGSFFSFIESILMLNVTWLHVVVACFIYFFYMQHQILFLFFNFCIAFLTVEVVIVFSEHFLAF